MNYKKYLPLIILSLIILSFFWPFFFQGKIPIPADTIVGLYHPYRDLYANDYPRGIPFKNSLITDPVRQQFPWKFLAMTYLDYQIIPAWNPFNFAGTPLIANFQSAVFYPINIFLLLPYFIQWWGFFIILQPLLSGLFMYLYLRNLKMNIYSAFLGGFTYAFCGFSVMWMEWGTLGHTALWLPLILLSIDKIFHFPFSIFHIQHKPNNAGASLKLAPKQFVSLIKSDISKYILWNMLYVLSISSAFFAGHLQIFFYLYIVTLFYFLARWVQFGSKKNILILYLIVNTLFFILTAVQWFPTLQFINLSARDIDLVNFQKEGWFLPVQHLIQFIIPDFFGNPATINYWGVWNYGELTAYVGILPLIMAIFACVYRYDKKTLFFGSLFFLSLIFALPSWFGVLPYKLQIPFLDTAQPTRLLFITDFALSILAAFGLDYFIKTKSKIKILFPVIFIIFIISSVWIFVLNPWTISSIVEYKNILVIKTNLYYPTIIIFLSSLIITLAVYFKKEKLLVIFIFLMIGITVVDLFRFAYKFTPFTGPDYLFPETNSIYYSRKFAGLSRVMSTDDRIFPPNFSIMYFTQTADGYDPLYLRRYGELIAAMERGKPDISPPFGFNRIIQPHNYNSKIADLLGIKYVLSLGDLSSPKLKKAMDEGQTKVYENKEAYDRAFFANNIVGSNNKQESIKFLFDEKIDLRKSAVVEGWDLDKKIFKTRNSIVDLADYRSNEITIKTDNSGEGFLVLTDSYYPTWHAKVCDINKNNCKDTKIYLTDYNFRGVVVQSGKHTIIFYNTLF